MSPATKWRHRSKALWFLVRVFLSAGLGVLWRWTVRRVNSVWIKPQFIIHKDRTIYLKNLDGSVSRVTKRRHEP